MSPQIWEDIPLPVRGTPTTDMAAARLVTRHQ
jgi:hypothetical protein